MILAIESSLTQREPAKEQVVLNLNNTKYVILFETS